MHTQAFVDPEPTHSDDATFGSVWPRARVRNKAGVRIHLRIYWCHLPDLCPDVLEMACSQFALGFLASGEWNGGYEAQPCPSSVHLNYRFQA